MKFFTTTQIRQLDLYTIGNEPIASIGLMERAADRILQQFKKDWSLNRDVVVLAGPGNNGGDGLALGRMLLQIGYDVQVVLLHVGNLSVNCRLNRERLLEHFPDYFTEQKIKFEPAELTPKTIIVDALFGSGLTRPLEGIAKEAVKWINKSGKTVVSIDIPSGLSGDDCVRETVVAVEADVTYSLQFPKLAFFLPENEIFVGRWKVIDIQLHPKGIAEMQTNLFYVEKTDAQKILKSRMRFSHKGNYGHALIWAGKKGMAGAAVLASKAALRSGAGLVTVHSEEANRAILQTANPEAIFNNELNNIEAYNAFAFGPGIGTEKQAEGMLGELLQNIHKPVVLDADALNIISQCPELLNYIPENSILTPHPKEFERIFGASENSCIRMEKAVEKAKEYGITIVLKGANTLIAAPDGKMYFNSTGNPGMATGGMGDVLTGIIAGLMAQNYSSVESAVLGVYLHGLSADLALQNQSEESLLASDVIGSLGNAFKFLRG